MPTFKLNPAPTFKATVQLTVPGSDQTAPIGFTFRHKGRTALDAWANRPSDAAGQATRLDDVAYLDEVIAAWEGPVDDNDRPVPYSPEALARLLEAYTPAGREIWRAYVAALTESREKK